MRVFGESGTARAALARAQRELGPFQFRYRLPAERVLDPTQIQFGAGKWEKLPKYRGKRRSLGERQGRWPVVQQPRK